MKFFEKILAVSLVTLFVSNNIFALSPYHESSTSEFTTTKFNSISPYEELSLKLDVPVQKLEELLKINENGKTYALIPLSGAKEHLTFWKEIFTFSDSDYMKLFTNGVLQTEEEIERIFEECQEKWQQNDKCPEELNFIL